MTMQLSQTDFLDLKLSPHLLIIYLNRIRIANRERAQAIVKSLGFSKADLDEKGGPGMCSLQYQWIEVISVVPDDGALLSKFSGISPTWERLTCQSSFLLFIVDSVLQQRRLSFLRDLDATLEFLVTLFRGSHYGNIFKDYDPRRDVFKPYSKAQSPVVPPTTSSKENEW